MKHLYMIEGALRNNIGDVLQGMVAKQFLSADAQPVDRENLKSIDKKSDYLLLANGWFIHDVTSFPPPDNVIPIYISVHVANSVLLKNPDNREHFKKHGPIGCRDHKTLWLMLGWGIPAYYSGCLTITSESLVSEHAKPSQEMLLVDGVDHQISESVKAALESRFGGAFECLSHDPPSVDGDFLEYCQRTEEFVRQRLIRYRAARLVVTTKIHCALPCLGVGANVLLVHPNPSDPRLDTVREFIRIFSFAEVSADKIDLAIVADAEKIKRRKNKISKIASSSVAAGANAIKVPACFEHRWLNANALLAAFLVGNAVRAGKRLPFVRGVLTRIF